MTLEEAKAAYTQLCHPCETIMNSLVQTIKESIETIQHVDLVYGRVKEKGSFLKKVQKSPEKYDPPFSQVEDFIGVRVLVTFASAAPPVIERLSGSTFSQVERYYKQPQSNREFGYEGHQLVFTIPRDMIPKHAFPDFPNVFEVQVKTLYMHAWSQAEHKLRYKTEKLEIPADIEKRISWLAANSWGSDRILEELREWSEET